MSLLDVDDQMTSYSIPSAPSYQTSIHSDFDPRLPGTALEGIAERNTRAA